MKKTFNTKLLQVHVQKNAIVKIFKVIITYLWLKVSLNIGTLTKKSADTGAEGLGGRDRNDDVMDLSVCISEFW